MTKLSLLSPCGISLAAVAAFLATPAAAEEAADAPGNDIVVTAAGYEQKITDAPASITVVTEEELRQRPYITLIDAVRDIEGVDVRRPDGTALIRGLDVHAEPGETLLITGPSGIGKSVLPVDP